MASSQASKERAVERQIRQQRAVAVIAAKVRTVEEQAKVRDALKAVWSKGGEEACNSGTDNREIPSQRLGQMVTWRRVRKERAVE